MINYENLKNPDLINEEILNIQDTIKSYESQLENLKQSNKTLQDTNQRLFLRVSSPENPINITPEKTTSEHMDELKDYFKKMEDKIHGNDKR